jgi:hypothetical protein
MRQVCIEMLWLSNHADAVGLEKLHGWLRSACCHHCLGLKNGQF